MHNKDEKEKLEFLQAQLEWTKQQNRLLDLIEEKLHEMKEIAEHALDDTLTKHDRQLLNEQLQELQKELGILELKLKPQTH
ncbi:hypothetical protein [Bacillus sp. FJAT-45066]|uniref:hypothetical protein n=1 Tax=Bacillus sp. FJAT-45066 TaxID=2011010 RepID=UPI000BB7EED3|nr:hypothetical protein [Bacillus sp. FJAT-45066]